MTDNALGRRLSEGVKNVTIDELYRDLSISTGKRLHQRVEVERRPDPVVAITKPLHQYDTRVFFYLGILYGFCRLDSSITERFREASGSSCSTSMHVFDKPIFTVAGFPDFVKTKVCRSIQSVDHQSSADLFDFITSQVVVDRKRRQVWKIKMGMVQVPDPFLADSKEPPQGHSLVVFTPERWDTTYVPVQTSALLITQPEIRAFPRNDLEFKAYGESLLNHG